MKTARVRRLLTTAGSCARALFRPFFVFLITAVATILSGGLVALASVVSDSDFARQAIAAGFGDLAGGRRLPMPVIKTANYTVLSPVATLGAGDPSGTVFTNRGAAGAVTFTLPAPTLALRGVYYDFFSVVGQNLIVNCGGANGVAFNNAAVTTVTCSTAGQLIGATIRAVCDGTSWLLYDTQVGVTYTLA